MRPLLLSAAAAILTLAAGLPATAAVQVDFVEPERYEDARDRYPGRGASETVLKELRRHIETLAGRYIAPESTLRIEILDVDLAGRFKPFEPHASDLRRLDGTTWPRIELRYTLTAGGGVAARAEERLSDMNYLDRPDPRYGSDRLRYEKRMLDAWFRDRFGGKG